MSKILCYGARSDGHFNAIHSVLNNRYQIDVIDDRLDVGTSLHGAKVVGGLQHKIDLESDYFAFIVGVGDNSFRKSCFDFGFLNHLRPFSVIHSSAVISSSASIGEGCFIGPNVTIGASVQIGMGSIINSNVVIEHDSIISNFCHIAPGCSLAGRVQIGSLSFLGIGSCVIPDIVVGNSCIIGAGSTVVDSISDNVVAFGEKAIPKRFSHNNLYNRNV